MKIAVIGMGVVGTHMAADVERAGHVCVKYDIRPHPGVDPSVFYWPPESKPRWATHEEVNACDAAFVCVSTPALPNGQCDLSAIDAVFAWLRVPVAIIRSTVPPGTTLRLWNASPDGEDFNAVFCPEFIGEGVNAPYNAMRQPPFVIIGAVHEQASEQARAVLASLYNSECEFVFTDSTTAECIKYAENIYLATKVTLFNEFYDWVGLVGGNWGQFVNGLTHDYRIGRSHTHVHPDNRGWDGRCLPKDTAALLALVGEDVAPLLAAVRRVNERQRAAGEG